MADIVYTIVYGPGAFQFPKPQILAIGGPDRVGFITTPETLQYLKGKQVALRRDGTANNRRDPFDEGKAGAMEPIYIVPGSQAGVKLFPVKKAGEKGAFHLTCGQVDADGTNFTPWTDATGKQAPSVPVP